MSKIAFVLCALALLFISSPVFATVGGPTYVYDLKYNPADSSVYYTQQSYSGRGCPPTLEKISATTFARSTVLTCDDGESLYQNGDYSNQNLVKEEIAGITETFRNLLPISLSRNNISIEIKHMRSEEMGDGTMYRNHFTATISQYGIKVADLSLTGCTVEQPFTFAGYAIPGLTQKMAIVVSAKSNCMEGGYIGESLHIVGAEVKNRTEAGSYKLDAPLTADVGTLIASTATSASSDTSSLPTTPTTPTPSSPTTNSDSPLTSSTLILAGVFLILGILLGHSIKK